jgi:biofilm protein TabA
MICQTLSDWKKSLNSLPDALKNALEWAEANIKSPPADGKYPLENGAYVIVQSYDSQPWEGKEFENHHKFIDVQVIVKGAEYIGWVQMDSRDISRPYDEAKDAEFCNPVKGREYTYLFLDMGKFAIFWPGDWHMPTLVPARKTKPNQKFEKVTKFVIKVPAH